MLASLQRHSTSFVQSYHTVLDADVAKAFSSQRRKMSTPITNSGSHLLTLCTHRCLPCGAHLAHEAQYHMRVTQALSLPGVPMIRSHLFHREEHDRGLLILSCFAGQGSQMVPGFPFSCFRHWIRTSVFAMLASCLHWCRQLQTNWFTPQWGLHARRDQLGRWQELDVLNEGGKQPLGGGGGRRGG